MMRTVLFALALAACSPGTRVERVMVYPDGGAGQGGQGGGAGVSQADAGGAAGAAGEPADGSAEADADADAAIDPCALPADAGLDATTDADAGCSCAPPSAGCVQSAPAADSGTSTVFATCPAGSVVTGPIDCVGSCLPTKPVRGDGLVWKCNDDPWAPPGSTCAIRFTCSIPCSCGD